MKYLKKLVICLFIICNYQIYAQQSSCSNKGIYGLKDYGYLNFGIFDIQNVYGFGTSCGFNPPQYKHGGSTIGVGGVYYYTDGTAIYIHDNANCITTKLIFHGTSNYYNLSEPEYDPSTGNLWIIAYNGSNYSLLEILKPTISGQTQTINIGRIINLGINAPITGTSTLNKVGGIYYYITIRAVIAQNAGTLVKVNTRNNSFTTTDITDMDAYTGRSEISTGANPIYELEYNLANNRIYGVISHDISLSNGNGGNNGGGSISQVPLDGPGSSHGNPNGGLINITRSIDVLEINPSSGNATIYVSGVDFDGFSSSTFDDQNQIYYLTSNNGALLYEVDLINRAFTTQTGVTSNPKNSRTIFEIEYFNCDIQPLTLGTTELLPPYCGATDVEANDVLKFFSVPGATSYTVIATMTPLNPANPVITDQITITNTEFKFSDFVNIPYQTGAIYTISIQAEVGSLTSALGNPCTVSAKSSLNSGCIINPCNLVVNGDFEELEGSNSNLLYVDSYCGWDKVSSALVLNRNSLHPAFAIPCSGIGYEDDTKGGDSYAWLISIKDSTNNGMIYSELSAPLAANTAYTFTMNVSLAERGDYMDYMYVYFSDDLNDITSVTITNPDMLFYLGVPDQIDGWKQLSVTFNTTNGGEKYMLIGNIKHTSLTPFVQSQTYLNGCYVEQADFENSFTFVDNISLVENFVPTITGTDNICPGDTEEVCVSFNMPISLSELEWTDDNNNVIASQTYCINITVPGTYTATYTTINGCQFSKSHVVGAGSTYSLLIKKVASNRSPGDHFGHSVAIDGNYAVVGAPENNSSQGAAYVFQKINNSWVQTHKLQAIGGMPGDRFGWAVDIKDNKIIVGAPGESYNTGAPQWWYNPTGAAYVFEYNGVDWSQTNKLKDNRYNGAGYGSFGAAVAIDGNYSVVGNFEDRIKLPIDPASPVAYYKDSIVVSELGSICFYNGGTQYFKTYSPILASLPTSNDLSASAWFGFSVAIDNDYVIVGADGENNNSGRAYLYNKNGSLLNNYSGANGELLGWDVDIEGNSLVIGSPAKSGGAGIITVLGFDAGGTWISNQSIFSPDQKAGDQFGFSVGISGNLILSSSKSQDYDENGNNFISSAGAAYIFDLASGGSSPAYQKIVASDRGFTDDFGWDVAISWDEIIVGAWLEDEDESGYKSMTDAGSVYFFGSDCVTQMARLANKNDRNIDEAKAFGEKRTEQKLSIDKSVERFNVSAFPNPNNSGRFSIQISSESLDFNNYQIVVTDILGKDVYINTSAKNNEMVDLSGNQNGIYILKVINGEEIRHLKLIYQK